MKWTEEEVEKLKVHFDETEEFLTGLLPNRTWKSIKHKITNMNLPRVKAYSRYSKDEDEIIKNNSHLNVSEIKKLLPNRTIESIIQRYNYLGFKWSKTWDFWSEDELDVIKSFDTIDEMCENLPNRTSEAVYLKAVRTGVSFNDYFTPQEDDILKENYNIKHVEEYIHLLPNRNIQSIYSRANKLGLKGVMGRVDITDEYIVNLFNEGMYPSEISRLLNITPNTVASRLRRNDIDFEPKILLGEDAPNWKGGLSSESKKARSNSAYSYWRESVFSRDNYTCQKCNSSKGGNLQAHHVLNFSKYKDLRYDVKNGITLCEDCHSPNFKGSFHSVYGTHNNTLEQLEEFLGRKLDVKNNSIKC